MSKRIVGLIVACVLAVSGGASFTVPAAAETQHASPAKVAAAKAVKAAKASKTAKAAKAAKAAKSARAAKAAKATRVKAAKAKAARTRVQAAAAKARRAAQARATYIAQVGRRGAELTKRAAAARAWGHVSSKIAAQARARATVTAKSAAAAQARAVKIMKGKSPASVKAKAKATAKAASKLAAKASARAATKAGVAAKAVAAGKSKTKAAATARAAWAAKARQRATAAAKASSAAGARATAASTSLAKARARAAVTAKTAAAAKARVVKINKSKAKTRDKTRAQAAARAAVKLAAKARARVPVFVSITLKARAVARTKAATAARLKRWAGPKASWSPRERLIFNNPRGSRRQKLAIISEINRGIDSTPAGGEIRMAMYLFDLGSVADKLIAANRRGVSVQVLIDDGESNRYIRRVRRALGKNKLARSYVATCHHGCMSNRTSVIHSKFYLFSVAGQRRNVSMISSANPYTGNTYKSWNNNHTIVGDTTIYDSLVTYFTDMLADKKDLNYFRVTKSGKYTMYLYPRKAVRPQDIVLLNVLNRTTCRTAGQGYGTKGRTLIRVANWGWSTTRLDIADRLWKLHDSGCKVQVMINKGRISRGVLKVLLKRSKRYGKMPVYDAWYDKNNNNVGELYVHDKVVTINGALGGRNVKITWTGSQNFTALGTLANNDILLRVIDPRVTHAYNVNFAYIRKHYTHRMYNVPWRTRRSN